MNGRSCVLASIIKRGVRIAKKRSIVRTAFRRKSRRRIRASEQSKLEIANRWTCSSTLSVVDGYIRYRQSADPRVRSPAGGHHEAEDDLVAAWSVPQCHLGGAEMAAYIGGVDVSERNHQARADAADGFCRGNDRLGLAEHSRMPWPPASCHTAPCSSSPSSPTMMPLP